MLDVILFIFDSLKPEVTVAGQEATLLFFPKGDELLYSLQDKATLVICEFTILPKSVNANNVALLLGEVCLLYEVFPNFLLTFKGYTIALCLILCFLLIIFPLSTGFFLLLACFVKILNVSHSFL